jgi:hypothetical protein
MKIVSVKLSLSLVELGEYQDPTPPEPEAPKKFNDDPLDKQERIMDKYLDRIVEIQRPPAVPGYFQMPGGGGNQLSLDRQFTILCTGFDELQQIVNAIEAQARKIHEAAPAPAAPQAFG